MTKHHENGNLVRVHIYMNADDWALLCHLSKVKGKSRIAPSELTRELLSSALRGLRPGQIAAYDQILVKQLELVQKHLTVAIRRIAVPKQGTTILVPKARRKRKSK